MKRVQGGQRFPAGLLAAVTFAAAVSCVLTSLVPTVAIFITEPSWRKSGGLAVLALILMDAVFALLLGFVGAWLFLAAGVGLAWKRRLGVRSLVVGGAGAGLIHAVCGWMLGLLSLALPSSMAATTAKIGAAVVFLGGFYLAAGGLAPTLRAGSWVALAALVVIQPAVGALAGWWAGFLVRDTWLSMEADRSIVPVGLDRSAP